MTVKSKSKVKARAKVATPSAARVLAPIQVAPPVVTGIAKRPLAENRKKLVAGCLLLAVMVAVVYFRATRNPFVNYDDQGYVVENEHVQHGVTLGTLRWALTSTEDDNWHPVTWMSHALDCQLFGLNAAGHHASSVVWHGVNAILLFLLLAAATGAVGRSFVVAALFALHPMNVESVAWIAERKNLLSTLFFLLSLGAYGWYAKRPGVMRYLIVALLFALGLAAKPMLVTLPFVLLLLDFWPLGRVEGLPGSDVLRVAQSSFLKLALEKVPLLALSVASSVITMHAQRGAIADSQSLPLLARLLNAVHAYAVYVLSAVWPTRLAAFYPYTPSSVTSAVFLLSLLFLAGVTVWVWRERRRRMYLVVGWCWFLGTMIPVIGLIQVGQQSRADRYAYLPLIGIFWMIVWIADDVLRGRGWIPRLKVVAAAAVLVACSWLTWRQIRVWNSSYDLWSHAIEVTADNYWAEDYVGSALLVKAYEASGQRYSEEALTHFRNAVRINPQDAIGHLNIGAYLHEHGQLPEAVQEYEIVLRVAQERHLRLKALTDLGAANQQLGNYAVARQYYNEVLKLDPANRAVFISMGKLAMEESIQQLATAAAKRPTSNAYFELGELQQSAGHIPEARTSFEAALKLDPRFAPAQSAIAGLDRSSKQ